MAHELLTIRLDPEMKSWLRQQVLRQQQLGEDKATLTSLIVSLIRQEMQRSRRYPAPAYGTEGE
jgi:hypothetical protein